jgi:hypothetical protein
VLYQLMITITSSEDRHVTITHDDEIRI